MAEIIESKNNNATTIDFLLDQLEQFVEVPDNYILLQSFDTASEIFEEKIIKLTQRISGVSKHLQDKRDELKLLRHNTYFSQDELSFIRIECITTITVLMRILERHNTLLARVLEHYASHERVISEYLTYKRLVEEHL